MSKLKTTVLVMLMIGLALPGLKLAQEEDKSLTLSLDECLAKAMENNLDVAVQILSPQLADIGVSQANEKFLPSLSFDFSNQNRENASYSFLDAAGDVATTTRNLGMVINQQIPTGANFSIDLSGYRNETNQRLQTINPRYGATLRFNFTQPLLKNFGFKMARREIIVARNNLNISEQDFQRALQTTVYSVEEAYWNLVLAVENLEVQQQSLELAKDLLEKNRRGVEVGTLAPIDVINAEAQVAAREADILAAEGQVKNAEDRLRQILNLREEYPQAELMRIIPADEPSYQEKSIELDEALGIALQNRPDLSSARIGLKNTELDLSYAKNQLLPDLSLTASYWSPGISGTRILYQNNNALSGIVVGEIPGGLSDSLADAFGFKYNNWSIGLSLDIPINSIFSRAAFAQARINLDRARLQLKNQELQIYTDIKIAVRDVETNFKRIQALKVARELAERQLEAENEKLRVGLSTNYQVLQYQRDLTTARSQENQAIINYNLALARLSRDMGVSLKEKNISVAGLLER